MVKPNPNPSVFRIVTGSQYGEFCVLEVYYPGCTPYAGNKILVYEDHLGFLQHRLELDPHFLEYPRKSPIARFPANTQGRNDARAFALMKSGGDSLQEQKIKTFKQQLALRHLRVSYRDTSPKTGTASLKVYFPSTLTDEELGALVRELEQYADKHVYTNEKLRHGGNHRFHFYKGE